jgi:hypothetical protein
LNVELVTGGVYLSERDLGELDALFETEEVEDYAALSIAALILIFVLILF